MLRILTAFVILLVGLTDGDDKTKSNTELIQIQSLVITYANTFTAPKETKITNLKVFDKDVAFVWSGNDKLGWLIIPSGTNSTFTNSEKNITWSLVMTADDATGCSGTVSGSVNRTTDTNVVQSVTMKGIAVVWTSGSCKVNPTTTVKPVTNESVFEPVTSVDVTLTYMVIVTKQEYTTVNKHSQAVVVAVIEGLLLGAILAVFLYKVCYLNKRQQSTVGSFPGSGQPNYFDNAAVSYRGNNASVPEERRGTYGYDQPAPIRVEMQNRTSDPFAYTTSPRVTPTTNSAATRTQTSQPSLMPVSNPMTSPNQQPASQMTSSVDPLSGWNDVPSGRPPTNLFD